MPSWTSASPEASSSKTTLDLHGGDPAPSPTSSTPPSTASPPVQKKQLSGWKHSAAGSIGGMAGAIVTSPFDVVKTRLQSDLFKASPMSIRNKAGSIGSVIPGPPVRKGITGGMMHFWDTAVLIRRIGTEEGWRALYKGLGPSLVGIIPARAINFYFYPTSKAFLAKRFPNAPTEKAGQTAEDSPVIHLSAAVIAGIMTATGTNPIWVVKTRLQLSARKKTLPAAFYNPVTPTLPRPIAASTAALAQAAMSSPATASVVGSTSSSTAAPKVAMNAVSTAMDIIRKEGIPGLYRGLSASYLGVSEGVIQWVLYERFKRIGKTTSPHLDTQPSLLSYVANIVGASGGAKAVASLITYPHEVIRTRLRQPNVNGIKRYTGLMQTLKLILKEEGAAALYGGLTAHMLRVVPNAACMFLIYEVVAEKLGS